MVNAPAYEIIDNMAVPITEAITVEHAEEAKERLILARATHLDSLVARLHENRIKPIIEAQLEGKLLNTNDPTYDDNLLYCRDLGLIAKKAPVRIANPIYHEVIASVLSAPVESQLDIDPHSFVLADGRLDMRKMLDEFATFWADHGDILVHGTSYHDPATQLVFMAFLQRVVNGGGYIAREYGVGRGRIDLLVRWPYKDAGGQRTYQREAIEVDVWRDKQVDPLAQGLKHLDDYLTKLGRDTGILVIFDRRKNAKPAAKRIKFKATKTPSKNKVTLLRA